GHPATTSTSAPTPNPFQVPIDGEVTRASNRTAPHPEALRRWPAWRERSPAPEVGALGEDAMNARRRSITIPVVLTALALALGCATSKELPKYTDSQTVTATAVVQAIDQNTREVTLKAENGNVFSFVAGDDVKNLSQVHVGDTVRVTYTESI